VKDVPIIEPEVPVKGHLGPGLVSSRTCWFVVIGARRTGTNLLREILNTNHAAAMLGEVFTPSPAPAHWSNFLEHETRRVFPPPNFVDAASLMDEYFEYVEYRIRNHWQDNKKAAAHALGFDVKYDQLGRITPSDNASSASPFLLEYFKSRRFVLIHTTRYNVIKCALSEIIAQRRNLWHNYGGARFDRPYYVVPSDCLSRARSTARRRGEFERFAERYQLIEATMSNSLMRSPAFHHGKSLKGLDHSRI
jgi:hypothetical protein